MEFAKVTAIIRNEMVENVELALEKAGVSGFTVTKVHGVGEWEKRFSHFSGPSAHCKIEIFTEENRAEQIAGVIMDAAHTGSVGDGLVAILPVHKVLRIRTKALANSGLWNWDNYGCTVTGASPLIKRSAPCKFSRAVEFA